MLQIAARLMWQARALFTSMVSGVCEVKRNVVVQIIRVATIRFSSFAAAVQRYEVYLLSQSCPRRLLCPDHCQVL